MQVRSVEDRRAGGWEIVVDSGRVRSLRYVSAADRVGFSLHLNVSESGDGRQLWYKHHWEANYIVSGEATLEDLDRRRRLAPARRNRSTWSAPRTGIALVDQRDICLVSVFCPSLRGDETHDSGRCLPAHRSGAAGNGAALRGETPRRCATAGHEKVVANGEASTLRMLTRHDQLGFSLSDVSPRGRRPGRPLVQAPLGGQPRHRRAGQAWPTGRAGGSGRSPSARCTWWVPGTGTSSRRKRTCTSSASSARRSPATRSMTPTGRSRPAARCRRDPTKTPESCPEEPLQ